VSKEAWRLWLEHQKMLVNENRLNLADKKARDYLA
jgi:Fe-S cluster biosynthesis and repair protein YggX